MVLETRSSSLGFPNAVTCSENGLRHVGLQATSTDDIPAWLHTAETVT